MNQNSRPLIAATAFGGAVVLGGLAVLCWTGVLPVDHGAAPAIALALGIAAAADAAIGLFFLNRSRQP